MLFSLFSQFGVSKSNNEIFIILQKYKLIAYALQGLAILPITKPQAEYLLIYLATVSETF